MLAACASINYRLHATAGIIGVSSRCVCASLSSPTSSTWSPSSPLLRYSLCSGIWRRARRDGDEGRRWQRRRRRRHRQHAILVAVALRFVLRRCAMEKGCFRLLKPAAPAALLFYNIHAFHVYMMKPSVCAG